MRTNTKGNSNKNSKIKSTMAEATTDLQKDAVQEKKRTQLIAFRADSSTLKIITNLEKISKGSRTEVLIRSLQNSQNGILFEDTINKMLPIAKKVFSKFKLVQAGFGYKGEELSEDDRFNLKFDEGSIFFNLPDYSCKTKDKLLICFLDKIITKLEIQSLRTIKIETISPIIFGPISKLEPSFFKRVHEVAVKNHVQVKSQTSKDKLGLDFRVERHIHLDDDKWFNDYEKILSNLKKSIEEIKNESCFMKEDKDKEKS